MNLPMPLFAPAIEPAGRRRDRVHLDYTAVMQLGGPVRPPFDDPGACAGTAEYRGLALFPDNLLVMHRYGGTYDLVDGAGSFEGEATWRFESGARLRARYQGTAWRDGPRVAFDGRLEALSGTGAFHGVQGAGRFDGQRPEPVAEGGTTHLQGRLVLDLDPSA